MSEDEAPEDFGERIRRIAASIAGEVDKRFSEESSAVLDAAARSLGAPMERWGRNPGLRRILGGVQRDEVTGVGEEVELSANLGVSSKRGSFAGVIDAMAMSGPMSAPPPPRVKPSNERDSVGATTGASNSAMGSIRA